MNFEISMYQRERLSVESWKLNKRFKLFVRMPKCQWLLCIEWIVRILVSFLLYISYHVSIQWFSIRTFSICLVVLSKQVFIICRRVFKIFVYNTCKFYANANMMKVKKCNNLLNHMANSRRGSPSKFTKSNAFNRRNKGNTTVIFFVLCTDIINWKKIEGYTCFVASSILFLLIVVNNSVI